MEKYRKKIEEAVEAVLKEDDMYTRQEDGTYVLQVTMDRGDELTDHAIEEILSAEDPEAAFYEAVEEVFDPYYKGDYFCDIVERVTRALGPSAEKEEEKVWETAQDILCEKLFFEYPYEAYLDQTVMTDLIIDTGDGNFDFSLNTVYPSWRGEKGEKLDSRASIVWLSRTQGYSKAALEKELSKGDVDDPRGYMETLRQEIANSSTGMNAVTFLVRMTMRDLLKIQKAVNEKAEMENIPKGWHKKESIHIRKATKTGFYDPWNGGGSCFEISLDKDLEVPMRFVASALPDVTRPGSWSVRDTYGLVNSAWRHPAALVEA